MAIRIGPTPATLRHLQSLRAATAVLNREMSAGLTGAVSDQSADLVRQWRTELRSVLPYTARGVVWEGSIPGLNMEARLYISQAVWRYMRLHVLGGTRRFPRGQIIYLPGVPPSIRRTPGASDRVEIPLRGGPNTIVLRRGAGGNRVLGFRIFEARYIVRASGQEHVARNLPVFIEVRVGAALDAHRRRSGG